MTAENQTVV